MLPAGVVSEIDPTNEKVYVDRTKEQIKNAPEFDADRYRDAPYRDELEAITAATDHRTAELRDGRAPGRPLGCRTPNGGRCGRASAAQRSPIGFGVARRSPGRLAFGVAKPVSTGSARRKAREDRRGDDALRRGERGRDENAGKLGLPARSETTKRPLIGSGPSCTRCG